MFPWMMMAQTQGEMVRQITRMNAEMFYLWSALPLQMMRTFAPIAFAPPLSSGRACMPFRF